MITLFTWQDHLTNLICFMLSEMCILLISFLFELHNRSRFINLVIVRLMIEMFVVNHVQSILVLIRNYDVLDLILCWCCNDVLSNLTKLGNWHIICYQINKFNHGTWFLMIKLLTFEVILQICYSLWKIKYLKLCPAQWSVHFTNKLSLNTRVITLLQFASSNLTSQ